MAIRVFALAASIPSRFPLKPSPKLFGSCYTLAANFTTLPVSKMMHIHLSSSPAHVRPCIIPFSVEEVSPLFFLYLYHGMTIVVISN